MSLQQSGNIQQKTNNINTRLNKATQNLKNEMRNTPGNSIINKLTGLTDNFKNMFSANQTNKNSMSNKNTRNTSGTHNSLDNPFNNPIMLWSLILITLGFMIYGLYYYYTTTSTVQSAKSYYGEDLLSYSPVFKINSEQIDPCIKRCDADPLCDGITFNRDELTCVGSKRGILRDDNSSLAAWVKPVTNPENDKTKNNKSIILVGRAKENVAISADKISYPGNPYEFNWSMYLYLNDHMANHGSWRHILHKGSEVPDQIDTPNWEDVLAQFPDQSVGIWMAPFNNNLRIALTTVTRGNPRSSAYEKNIEFFDIYQFPVRKLMHLSVNVLESTIEVYMDGMIYKVFALTGRPEFNRGNLYVMKPKSVDGYIQKLSYAPAALKLTDIKSLLNN